MMQGDISGGELPLPISGLGMISSESAWVENIVQRNLPLNGHGVRVSFVPDLLPSDRFDPSPLPCSSFKLVVRGGEAESGEG